MKDREAIYSTPLIQTTICPDMRLSPVKKSIPKSGQKAAIFKTAPMAKNAVFTPLRTFSAYQAEAKFFAAPPTAGSGKKACNVGRKN
jgi:hypothetical protein